MLYAQLRAVIPELSRCNFLLGLAEVGHCLSVIFGRAILVLQFGSVIGVPIIAIGLAVVSTDLVRVA